MLRYALYSYIPKRYTKRLSFEDSETNRLVLDFKDGRKYACERVARDVSTCLSAMNLKNTLLVCVPASCEHTTRRRYSRFYRRMVELCGVEDSSSHINIIGHRGKRHLGFESQSNVSLDTSYFSGRDIILFDDIVTTGTSSNAFIQRLEEAGGKVRLAIFLAKTKRMKRYLYQ